MPHGPAARYLQAASPRRGQRHGVPAACAVTRTPHTPVAATRADRAKRFVASPPRTAAAPRQRTRAYTVALRKPRRAAISAATIKTRIADGVLHVLIDRAAKRNALAQAVLGELGDAFRAHAADADLRLAVVRGAGERCFAAGGDLHEFEGLREPDAVREMNRFSTAALDTIRDFPVPVVAAMNGDAIGGGGELALACDMRVFARHARLGFVQGQMCISTAWGGGADLMRVAGPATALRMLTRAEFIAAEQARVLGLADAVQDADEDFEQALERYLAPMRERKPHIMRAYKTLARTARQDDAWRAVRAAEPALLESTWLHDDHWAASAAAIARIAAKKNA